MTKKRIHLLYGWVLTVGLIIAGILLICACVSIYWLGDQPFSPETVAVAFSRISVPVYLCLVLIGGGFLLQLCLPLEEKKSVTPFYPMQLARLQSKLDLDAVTDNDLRTRIQGLRRKRLTHTAIAYGLLVVCGDIFLSYGLNPANFHQSEINRSMAAAMLLFFPCLAIPFGYGCFAAYYGLKLTKEEIALTRKALKEAQRGCVKIGDSYEETLYSSCYNTQKGVFYYKNYDNNGVTAINMFSTEPAPQKEGWLLWVRLGLLCLGLFLLCYGFYAGGTADVLTKAINICTECVGLG